MNNKKHNQNILDSNIKNPCIAGQPALGDIPENERTPLVNTLLDIIHAQQTRITQLEEEVELIKETQQGLKDEIARLKSHRGKPKIPPSSLEKKKKSTQKGKRAGSNKRSKNKGLDIHETVIIHPKDIPTGSKLRGYQDYIVQDLVIKPNNTKYRLAYWLGPDGKSHTGKLPVDIQGHFGPMITSFIMYQYYHAQVTQPLLWEQLREFGIDISKGQLNRIITENKKYFHQEKDEILISGLELSSYINVDDTSARHQGKNGYCTQIGNELFSWFRSTESKSRINFLELLRNVHTDYILLDSAFDYMRQQKLPQSQLDRLYPHQGKVLSDQHHWLLFLATIGITNKRHVRIATEGALIGSILSHGFSLDCVIVSDDAGQFNILNHGLCWLHAERTINKLIGFSDAQRQALEQVRSQIWDLYTDLKEYKSSPNRAIKPELEARFDAIFIQTTCFSTLNQVLKRIYKNKSELLLVLKRPDIPLHNNLSEQAIREYVKKRKISGSTRSELGRRCRDTFTSLKKTCRKLGISFWSYLQDRNRNVNDVPWIPDTMRIKASEGLFCTRTY
jgi:hypothetical protein